MNDNNLRLLFKMLIMKDQGLGSDEISTDEIAIVSENKFLWQTDCGPHDEPLTSAWMITDNGKLICLVESQCE